MIYGHLPRPSWSFPRPDQIRNEQPISCAGMCLFGRLDRQAITLQSEEAELLPLQHWIPG
jgi:hypothetical protein